MTRFLWVCVAGGLGSGTRYLMSLWAIDRFGPAFPYGTLIVNTSGCFLIAVVLQAGAGASWSDDVRAALTAGFLGGFTTYSAFNHETLQMFQNGPPGVALLHIIATLLGGLAAGWLGLLAARQLFG